MTEELRQILREENLCGFNECKTVQDLVRELKCDCLELRSRLKYEEKRNDQLEKENKMLRRSY